MSNIAVIGGPETVMGFKALGLEVFPVRGEDEARKAFRRLLRAEQKDDYAIIYIEENLAASLKEDIDRLKDHPTPAVILIPGKDGPLGLGESALRAAVERAVGSDIL